MGLFSADIGTFQDLYIHQLEDIYYAEQQITKALPKMIDKATDLQLKQGFETHLRETEGQIERLKQVFQLEGMEPKGVTFPAIDGIIKEANELAGEVSDKKVLDAALTAAAQAVEHYEISRYGTLTGKHLPGRAGVYQIEKLIEKPSSGRSDADFPSTPTVTAFSTLMARRGASCSTIPAQSSRKTQGAARPSMTGTSGPSISITALSTMSATQSSGRRRSGSSGRPG